jgi:hypothetical protein
VSNTLGQLPPAEVYLQAQQLPVPVFTSPGTGQMCVRDAIWKAPLDLQLPPAEVYLQAQLFHGFGQCLSFSGSVTAGTNLSLVRSHEVVHSHECLCFLSVTARYLSVTARYLSVTARYLSVTARYLSVTAGGKEGTRLRREVKKLTVTSHQRLRNLNIYRGNLGWIFCGFW